MKKVVKILRGIGYLMAFSLILYPVVSNYINQMNSTTIATDYEQEVSHLSEEQENAMIKQAQDYNESLIGIGSIADPFSESNENQTEDDEYNKLLKIDDEEAHDLFAESGKNVKTAIIMHIREPNAKYLCAAFNPLYPV